MEKCEIRVLTKKHALDGAEDHAALRRTLALASPLEAVVEVWFGARCVYAGELAEVRFPEWLYQP